MKILSEMIKESYDKVRVVYEAVEYTEPRNYSEFKKEVEFLDFYLQKLKQSINEKHLELNEY